MTPRERLLAAADMLTPHRAGPAVYDRVARAGAAALRALAEMGCGECRRWPFPNEPHECAECGGINMHPAALAVARTLEDK